MPRKSLRPCHRAGLFFVAIALVGSLFAAAPARADESSGTVTFTAWVGPQISLTFDHTSANFGTNLNPDGRASNSADSVCSTFPDASPMYYIWGTLNATVNSTVAYTRYISATENSGSSSVSIASGDFRYLGAVTMPDASGKCRDSVSGFQLQIPSSWIETSALGYETVPLHVGR